MREQPARCGNHHIGTAKQPSFLYIPCFSVISSVYCHRREGGEIGKTFHLLVDLLCQFSCGSHDDGIHLVFLMWFRLQVVQEWEQKGCCLARAGLGAGNHILLFQDHRDRQFLHGSHFCKIHRFQALLECIAK